ncbi:hypothetical protein Ct61P_05665 [Colletotrichum tofieldiae]|nr:hypothetical protein Ct61P_05665 [Colletotrichum tofieldiae]
MPVQLLPASAAAFAPRASSVNVVLGSKVEPWLTQTLKRINRVKRPLNSCKKLHEDFVQAINKFVYRTHVSALEGLEEEGAGELLSGKSEEVKNNIMSLMKPLLPPPPRVVDVIRQPPLLPSSPANANIWSQPPTPAHLPAVDAWRVLPSSPSIASTSQESTPIWANIGMSEVQIPSPTPSFSQPFSTAGFYYSAPAITAPIPALPLPSMFTPQCGVSVGYGGFGWDRYQEYATTM